MTWVNVARPGDAEYRIHAIAGPLLRNKGLPEVGGGRCGDLFLRIAVKVPEKLSAKEKALYDQLRALDR